MSQSININMLSDDYATINGKTVYKDANDNWVSQSRLTQEEKEAFQEQLQSV